MAVQEHWFDTEAGPRTLAELFGGHARLLVPHFAFDAGWHAALPSCTPAAERCERDFERLAARGVSLVAVSPAPIDAIAAYKWRMGWSFAWVSSLGTGFDIACGVAPASPRPRLSDFVLRDGAVHRTGAAPRQRRCSLAPSGIPAAVPRSAPASVAARSAIVS